MRSFEFLARSEADTTRLGKALADTLPPGTAVALIGTLGAGKTRLVQCFSEAMGVPKGLVASPTFVLCHEYTGRLMVYHLDAYRLRDDDEFLQLGPEEYFDSDGITFVEWGDRVIDCLPHDRVEIEIDICDKDDRRFVVRGYGNQLAAVVDELSNAIC